MWCSSHWYSFRLDKKLFRPCESVKSWFIIIYETERGFNEPTAKAMAKAFCESAKSVGRFV